MRLTQSPTLSAFLSNQAVATLAVHIDVSGTLHIATLHYVHLNEPLRFYFVTQKTSEKCRLLEQQPEVKAACNVGTFVGTPFTLQMRGSATMLTIVEHPDIMQAYYDKRQSKNRNVEGNGTILLEFTPDWARFTDFSKGWDTTPLELA